MAKKVTTLFIRDDAVKLLIMDGKQVKMWASLPLEPGLVSQGLVVDEAQVAGKLKELFKLVGARKKFKELFKLAGLRKMKVIVGLSELNSLYRLISLPELPEAVVAEAVKQEAKRVIPVPLEEVYLSYQRLPSPVGETRIFLATFPRNVADALISTLRKADIKPYIMDLAPLALCRTLDEPWAIIVNARLEHLDIMVMEDRLPQLIRRLSLPGETTSLAERLPAIAEEINRTVAFYNSSRKEKPLDATVPMFVCGELAEVPESWQSLSGRLNCRVSILPSPVESPKGFDTNEFMVNIGLALKKLLPAKGEGNFSLVNFNALPEIYMPRVVPLSTVLAWTGASIGIIFLVYGGFMVHNTAGNISVLRSQLAPLETSIARESEQIRTLRGQVTNLEAQIKSVQATAKILDTTLTSLESGRVRMHGDLTDIERLLPRGVAVSVTHRGAAVTVNGRASSAADIFNYAEALERSFTSVRISSITAQEEDGKITFSFVFLLK